MGTVRDPNDYMWSGNHQFGGGFALPDGCITDAKVPAGANIDEAKFEHRAPVKCAQAGTVVAATESIYIAFRPGVVAGFKAVLDTIPTGADRTITIDIKKSTAGGAYASILSAPLVLDDDSVAKVVEDFSISGTPAIAEDDILQIVITVAGSAGAQGAGLLVWGVVVENGA
jgi:hypothetical protein